MRGGREPLLDYVGQMAGEIRISRLGAGDRERALLATIGGSA